MTDSNEATGQEPNTEVAGRFDPVVRPFRNQLEQWHKENDYKWMNDEQWECFEMLCDLCGGANHIGGTAKPSNVNGITIVLEYGFNASTYDYSGLTQAVILAHDRSIRFEIKPATGNKLRLFLHKRINRAGDVMQMHPTLEEATSRFREA